MKKQNRISDYGIQIGTLPHGPYNKISDVPGVTVGHCTVTAPGHNTGVTVLFPSAENIFLNKLPAAAFVWNGFGKTTGLLQIEELGVLETPIALTNTLNVGLVQDAMVEYSVRRCQRDGVDLKSLNTVVCECNDSSLNQISERVIGQKEVFQAIENACPDFEEGDVGAGKGTVCHGLKGGIGSASRVLSFDDKEYTLGILVQTNHGRLSDLIIGHREIGQEIAQNLAGNPDAPDKGSVIMVIGTDLPVSDRQLKRIIKRASVGLARLGSFIGHGSGEIMIGFSTANQLQHQEPESILPFYQLNEAKIDLAFRAAAEACEEAVLNSMICAQPVIKLNGETCHSLAEFLPPCKIV